eukprot:6157697-Amphidinium_carterae.4
MNLPFIPNARLAAEQCVEPRQLLRQILRLVPELVWASCMPKRVKEMLSFINNGLCCNTSNAEDVRSHLQSCSRRVSGILYVPLNQNGAPGATWPSAHTATSLSHIMSAIVTVEPWAEALKDPPSQERSVVDLDLGSAPVLRAKLISF